MIQESSVDCRSRGLTGQASRRKRNVRRALFCVCRKNWPRTCRPAQRLDGTRKAWISSPSRSEPVKIRVRNGREVGGKRKTVIETRDRRIARSVVDSCREYLHQLDVAIVATCCTSMSAWRAMPMVESFPWRPAAPRAARVTYLHVVLEIELGDTAASDLAAELKRRMHEVLAAGGDFENMTARALRICEELAQVRELVEVRGFLRWLVNDWPSCFSATKHYQVNRADGAHPRWRSKPAVGWAFWAKTDRAERKTRSFHTIESLEPGLLFNGPVRVVSK